MHQKSTCPTQDTISRSVPARNMAAKQEHGSGRDTPVTRDETGILILGGGFGGISALQRLEKTLKGVKITIVSEDNFFLFTPMLPEMASGTIHPSDISIPIRKLCKNAEFVQAKVSAIDLKNSLVAITRTFDGKVRILNYDYLVVAMGGTTNFFGNKRIQNNSFTMKTIQDAIAIKNHLLHMLEIADGEENHEIQKKLLTVVVVGAGFAGVETIGELNDFVRESASHYYKNINPENIRMILVSGSAGILPELDPVLSKKAMISLEGAGIRIITKTKAVDAGEEYVFLGNGETIQCATLIWTAGLTVDPVVASMDCEHKSGRITVNEFLQVHGHSRVFALGDCAAIRDSKTDGFYPPTAQHALREGRTVAHNITAIMHGTEKRRLNFESKGMMAIIGRRNGIAMITGYRLSGTLAWIVWKTYYLTMLPTFEKKFKVALDWTCNMFFKRDITLVRRIKKKTLNQFDTDGIESIDQILFKKEHTAEPSA